MKLIAIKKDGKYYCRNNDQYPSDIPAADKIRFDVPRMISFSQKWVVFGRLPTSAEKCIFGRDKIKEYHLKDEYEQNEKILMVLPADCFDCIGRDCEGLCLEYKNQDIKGLYNPIIIKTPDTWEPIELEIDLIDEDCEPLVNPKYKYKVKFPYYIENHKVVQHKYPCSISGDQIFQLIRNAVKKELPDHCYISSDYNFSFVVKVRAPVTHEETSRVDISSFNARKTKFVDRPLRNIDATIIEIETSKNNRRNNLVLSDINADNYAELEQKTDMIIQEYVDKTKWKPSVCPYCKGYGWV